MNKIFNINLGGFPFTIDEDAYLNLNQYLKTIKSHFSDSEGCEEILEDIEIRLGELFNDQLKGRQIVTNNDLEAAISIMGKPEDFGAESIKDDHTHQKQSNTSDYKKSKSKKRLFRDPDNKVIGGVCSGLAAYFGLEDPLWIRIGWVVLFVTGGMGLFLYLILWIAMPVAKTSADKLAMRGENVNISSIAKQVENELYDISDKIGNTLKDFGSKKKG